MERLRDSEGASYSPSATVQSSYEFPEWGFFFAGSEIRPERADLFFRLAREIVADLAAKPGLGRRMAARDQSGGDRDRAAAEDQRLLGRHDGGLVARALARSSTPAPTSPITSR